MSQTFSERSSIVQAITPAAGAAGTTEILGSVVDMENAEGVVMLVYFGPIVTGAVTSIKAQQGNASDLSDAADLLGTGQTISDSSDNTSVFIEIARPLKRYLRVAVERATQNATVGGAFYIKYAMGRRPATDGAGVSGETFVSPIEGTA